MRNRFFAACLLLLSINACVGLRSSRKPYYPISPPGDTALPDRVRKPGGIREEDLCPNHPKGQESVHVQPSEVEPQKEIGKSTPVYMLQIGAFKSSRKAAALADEIASEKWKSAVTLQNGFHKVRVVGLDQDALRELGQKLLKSGKTAAYFFVNETGTITKMSFVAKTKMPAKKTVRAYGQNRHLLHTARTYMGVPYRWGGTSPRRGFDCSGFTQKVFKKNGFQLPRTSKQQFRSGSRVRGRIKPGDLVFFSSPRKRAVSHVGLYLGEGRFIHASAKKRKVTVDRINAPYYKKNYRGARRVF